jgi:helicase
LVPTNQFPCASFPFEKFNPVQSRVIEIYDQDANIVVAAATSAGKTVVAEMYLSHEVRKRGGKGLYLSPLKALSQEKIDDWTNENHHFHGLNLSICTGDYRLTPERKEELEASDIILMTTEMLNSRCRNDKSESNGWLRKVGTVVVDECHLLTVPGRGSHLEAGLMKLTEINPDVRLVLLSATMPNVGEISDWVSYSLTGRETYLLESTYRPCPLTVYYERYSEGGSYDINELEKVRTAISLLESYPDDKFLIFTHTKRTGDMLKREIQFSGEECEFHNADLEAKKRIELEHRFKNDPKFRVIIATSTLAWGCNFPARRVIVLGVHRGLEEVATYDVIQEIGRAGRVGYDPCGDAYILLPDSKFDYHVRRLRTPQKIKSQMLENMGGHYKVLAFHLVSEIHHGNVKTIDDVHHWYERSLASWQANELEDNIVDSTMTLLKNCGAIWEEEDGTFIATSVGKVSSMFYYSPFDVCDLKKNFSSVFEQGKEEDDFSVALALGNTDTQRFGIVSRVERETMGNFIMKAAKRNPGISEAAIKAAYVYYQLLNGRPDSVFAGITRGLQFDFPRVIEVLGAIDTMGAKWMKKKFLNILNVRIKYGVKAELVPLCGIPNIGKVRAEKLWAAGIRSIVDFVANPTNTAKILGMKLEKINQICNAIKPV